MRLILNLINKRPMKRYLQGGAFLIKVVKDFFDEIKLANKLSKSELMGIQKLRKMRC